MVFALTNDLKVFKPNNPEYAVTHYRYSGPYFYGALALNRCIMNKKNGVWNLQHQGHVTRGSTMSPQTTKEEVR